MVLLKFNRYLCVSFQKVNPRLSVTLSLNTNKSLRSQSYGNESFCYHMRNFSSSVNGEVSCCDKEFLDLIKHELDDSGLGPILNFNEESLISASKWISELWAENKNINIISRKQTKHDIVVRHFIDSALAAPLIHRDIENIADLGSGTGFPSFPLALMYPKKNFYLYESRKLKFDYLNSCKSYFPNVEIRGKITPQELKDSGHDMILARGFKPINQLMVFLEPYLLGRGSVLIFGGRKAKINSEFNKTKYQSNRYRKLLRLIPVPRLGNIYERHIVLVKAKKSRAPWRGMSLKKQASFSGLPCFQLLDYKDFIDEEFEHEQESKNMEKLHRYPQTAENTREQLHSANMSDETSLPGIDIFDDIDFESWEEDR